MLTRTLIVLALALPCAALAQAIDDEEDAVLSPWSGSSGEFGFAATRGNSSTESLNGRLRLRHHNEEWTHSMELFGLRSGARITIREDDQTRQERRTTANRYSIAIGSAWELGEYRQVTGTLRHEHDSFATVDSSNVLGLSYGTRLIDGERLVFDSQIGPGARRSHEARTDEYSTELIARGVFDLKLGLTDNTDLVNTLMVETGSSNTFAQNDFGVTVAMNKQLALKAGWQARYNSDVDPGRRTTDTLATMNVVYRFK